MWRITHAIERRINAFAGWRRKLRTTSAETFGPSLRQLVVRLDERLIPLHRAGRVAYLNDEYGTRPSNGVKVWRGKRIKPSAWALQGGCRDNRLLKERYFIDRIIRRNVQRIQQINLSAERNSASGI